MDIELLKLEMCSLAICALGTAVIACTADCAESTNLSASTPSRFATLVLNTTPTFQFAALEKLRVHYKTFGVGNNAVVFVHGFTADMNSWRLQVPAFAGKGRMILLDLPGHGRSDKPASIDYTMALYAKAVNAVMEDAGVQKAALVGHSMGTSVAREFYRQYPAKTIAIIAVDGMIVPLPFAAPDNVSNVTGQQLREELSHSFGRMFTTNVAQEVRQSLMAAFAATPDHVLQSTMTALADPATWKEDTIQAPLEMILCANPYSPWPADYEQHVRKLAPRLEFHRIQGTGHFLMLDRPQRFNAILGEFLKKQRLIGQ